LAERYRIVEHYEQLLRFYSTFDMEGLVLSARIILTDAPDALPSLYLQVDEYQDLNPMDQNLVNLAASHPRSQVVVVGDDAQSIYGFRHANFQGVRDLWDSPDWDRIQFPDSHRLPAHILNAAQALIADQGYLGALNPKPDDGRRILTLRCTTSDLQIEAVAWHIHQLKSTAKNRDGEPLDYRDFLVLCLTSNHVSRTAQALADRFGVPARAPARASIPEDLWRLLLVLRMLHFQDGLALRQWLPLIGLGKEVITTIRRDAMDKGQGLYTYGAEMDDPRVVQVYSAIERLRDSLADINTFTQAVYQFPGLSVRDDVLSNFVSSLEIEDGTPLSVGWLIHSVYEKFGLVESEADVPDEDSVLVTTLHSAKGLEAEYVFCMWLNASFMPMAGRDAAEERRVLYVALTRAKMDVILTFHEVFDKISKCRLRNEAMSPFLHEIGNHLAIDRVMAKDLR
jgi:DNA helicase-2/ATP-dependent DNA helicase PcrA